jgi:general secretion pathway protein E
MQILKQIQIPYSFAKRHGVLLRYEGDQVFIVRRKDTARIALQEARRILGKAAHDQLCTDQEFHALLSSSYAGDTGESQQVAAGLEDHPDLLSLADQVPEAEDLMDQEDDAPIVRLINALLSEAIRVGASDIHIEAFEKKLSVRLRVDGQLREIVQPRRELAPLLVSRIKVMAKLDIAEKRLPQDGRISLRIAGRSVDVRVSTLPTQFGERVVLRLLDQKNAKLDLTSLGMDAHALQTIQELLTKPHGIILLTGPTGSGKTTTLYAMLTDINDVHRNIMTVEDPIEYYLVGISQTQVNPKVDLTFARGLRAILRQDPDVVMVGEIRDRETAEMAVQASLTGHLVLSTLHTNSTVGAITRLRDMGVEPFLLSATLIGVIAQRLVRQLCGECKKRMPLTIAEGVIMGIADIAGHFICHKVGCERCHFTGFFGRIGLYETMVITPDIAYKIHEKSSEAEIRALVSKQTVFMREKGFQAILKGITTIDEVLRVTSEDI